MFGKRVIATMMAIVLAVGLAPLPAHADMETAAQPPAQAQAQTPTQTQAAARTQLQAQARPTIDEIKAAWKAIPAQPAGKAIFSTVNNNEEYRAATLTPGALEYAQAYLNFLRYSAGLDPVTLDATLNANAAQGALIMAATRRFSHYPSTPEVATDEQAKPGKYACATSNISYAASYPEVPNALQSALQGQMNDSGSESNLSSVGHRRWLLNPATSTMGIGVAYAKKTRTTHEMYTAVRVFTNPRDNNYDASYGTVGQDGSSDIGYVAWPAEGNFANNVFEMGTPWSISLNPKEYRTPSAENVQVSVTRAADGATWTMTGADAMPSKASKYLAVDAQGIGTGSCIIFNPGSDNVGEADYSGTYQVRVTGLQTTSGADATLSYAVDFFDAGASAELKTPKITLKAKTKKVKLKNARKRAISFNIGAKSSSGGKLSYVVTVKNSQVKFKKGTATLKKVGKPGTYAIQVKVTTAAAGDYKKFSKKFPIVFKVRR